MTTAIAQSERAAAHTMPGHPEHAGRLDAVLQLLDSQGVLARLIRLEPRQATTQDLEAIHSAEHVRLLGEFNEMSEPVMIGADTYFLPGSESIAREAAGAALQVVDAVCQGEAQNALALVRPPGHHATRQQAMGFCLYNNIAAAARYAQRAHSLDRVAIVDYDVHHGNGTQDIFYEDPTVLYISLHQVPLYPGTGMGNEIGRGAGQGATLNVPMPPNCGDDSYFVAFDQLVLPVLRRFQPELLLISAGFDAHWRDPLANIRLSLAGFHQLNQRLMRLAHEICSDRVIFVMEGGYDLEALSWAWVNVAQALLGDDDHHDPLGAGREGRALSEKTLEHLRQLHKLA